MTLSALSLISLLSAAQEDYAAQMAALREKMEQKRFSAFPEVSITLDREWQHARLYTVDFVARKAGAEEPLIAELNATPFNWSLPVSHVHEGFAVQIVENSDWGAMRVEIGADMRRKDTLDAFLAKWHWDWEANDLPGGRSTGVIHAISADETGIGVDFGSAPPDAFLDLITTLASAGFDSVEIRSDRTSD